MRKKVIPSNTSTHTASTHSTLLVIFKLLAIVVVITADRMLLNFLLLLHLVILFLFDVFRFCVNVDLFLLSALLQLVFLFKLNHVSGVLVQVEFQKVPFEGIVSFRHKGLIFFDFPNFFQVLLQVFACI